MMINEDICGTASSLLSSAKAIASLLRRCVCLLVTLSVLALLNIQNAHAARIWDGGDNSNVWSATASAKKNWDSDSIFVNGEDATFAGSSQLAPTVSGTFAVGNIEFASGASSFGIDGSGSLTLNGSVTNSSTNNQTLTNIIMSSGAHTFNAAAGNLTVSGGFSGAGGITKEGTNTLTMSGPNTYTGLTSVNGGKLALTSGGSINNSSGVRLAGTGNFDVSAKSGGYSVSTLGGVGSVTGNLTVSGTLGINGFDDTIKFDNNLTLGGSSVSNFEISSFTSGNYDLATNLLAGSQAVNFGGTLNLLFDSGFSTNGTVKIFDFDTYGGGFTSVVPTGLAAGFTATFDPSNGIVTVVPESTAALLGALGVLTLLRRRRRVK